MKSDVADQMRFSVRGLQVGTTPFVVVGRQADGRKVSSRPHTIQVYAPLTLRPKHVWLIMDSVFQVRVYILLLHDTVHVSTQ